MSSSRLVLHKFLVSVFLHYISAIPGVNCLFVIGHPKKTFVYSYCNREIYDVFQATKKRDMFGYWTSFLPDLPGIGGPPQGQTLFTTIMKDPSPKVGIIFTVDSYFFIIYSSFKLIIHSKR